MREDEPESTEDRLETRALGGVRRLVVKVGTRVLTGEGGDFDEDRLRRLSEQIARQHGAGRQVLLVTSGAVGLGARILGHPTPPSTLEERQACAAVGQSRLMHLYERAFGELGVVAAQVLLTDGDFDDRSRYLNLRSTLSVLLRRGVVPIINENDAVSVAELRFDEEAGRRVFGDNDHLSALVATKLGADLLVLLTDVEGLFDRDPGADGARLISRLEAGDTVELDRQGGSAPSWGRGGMRSKVEAAWRAARGGCHTVIAPGRVDDVLDRVLAGEAIGSWLPAGGRRSARQQWIALAARPQGALVLDDGAVEALRRRGASLLAAGISRVEGDFERGDVVELRDERGERMGRGIIFCDAESTRRWCRGERPPGARNHHAVVHRDHLVLEEPTPEEER